MPETISVLNDATRPVTVPAAEEAWIQNAGGKWNTPWLLLMILAQLAKSGETLGDLLDASGGGSNYTATSTSVTVLGPGSQEIVTANSSPKRVSVMNNSNASNVWVMVGGTPVADSGNFDTPAGDAQGILIAPGGYWETPVDIVDQVRAIPSVDTNSTVITLTVYSK